MANTITLVSAVRQRTQFQGLFSEMWKIRATIDDQDAVAIGDTVQFDLTVTGLALGDIVCFWSSSLDFEDSTADSALPNLHVAAADTLTLTIGADISEFAADALNTAVIRAVVGRPNW